VFSSVPHAAQRQGEPPCHAKCPNVPIVFAEPSAVARGGFKSILQVVARPEIRMLCCATGKSVLIALTLLVFASEELLHAPDELGAPHSFFHSGI
jgi:hypothetical protein